LILDNTNLAKPPATNFTTTQAAMNAVSAGGVQQQRDPHGTTSAPVVPPYAALSNKCLECRHRAYQEKQ